ncbi:hypothetical protein O181_031449 [Austropuccinia psidii MF-1]|uniref:Reverse transcriptase RNase H-like domain-containing protein n=1 Tax=Austropuccinia psidii MF-1 TaxID=1389203 RepID=A0A9Q3CVR0_9BASI|nr:hypothetical protein [Austropuccinia psidii MF-1]
MSDLPEKITLMILDSSEPPSLFVTHHTKYMVELPSFPSFKWDFLLIDTPKREDLILGFDVINHFNPSIDWRQGLITFNSDHKDYYDPSNSFINDFSSAKSCASLVDEVFKETQDVGEDHSASSLHLFFGNIDLPPSSYHDSLEELWYEEEEPGEIEIAIKPVSSSYHQYLDVFSKVKAQKLPPHHACNHHIELEGSLPPVGVMYSLSNHESDTLRAYISGNVSDPGKQPIVFDSHKRLPEELNYEIHDKELLGIVWALKRWRAFLLSLSSSFEVHTDNSSLQYFMSSKILPWHQARWPEFLSEFHFSITDCLKVKPQNSLQSSWIHF